MVGAGIGVGMAATANPTSSGMNMGPSTAQPTTTGKHATKRTAAKVAACERLKPNVKVNAAKQAWVRKYGVNRCTMPNLAPVSQASAVQRSAATTLLQQTEADTAKYANLATAKAAGFDLQASLTRAERRHPGLAKAIARVDSAGLKAGGMGPMLHVGNKANSHDGKLLDPNAPETLMYAYTGRGAWKLIGVMYTAKQAFPNLPPDPGGPITRWHYHPSGGGQSLMMHLFFVSGNDLARAYAATMT